MRKAIFAALAFSLACNTTVSVAEPAKSFVVFAASSLTESLSEVAAAFTKATAVPVKISFAASSVLARQIEAGVPAEVFFAADEEWMDYLEKQQLLMPGSRQDVLANQLVLIGAPDTAVRVRISSGAALLSAIGRSRIATGDPDSVPVGKYAEAALTSLGIWNQIAPRVVRAENVRSALAFVARSDTPFGIVYFTDAKVEPKVRLLDTFPEQTHPPIRYPIALTRKAGENAKRFVEFVTSKPASAVFIKYGFSLAP